MVWVVDENATPVLETHNIDDPSVAGGFYNLEPGVYSASCVFPKNTFAGRSFFLSVHLVYPKTEHIFIDRILEFKVVFKGYNNVYGKTYDVFIRPQLSWAIQQGQVLKPKKGL